MLKQYEDCIPPPKMDEDDLGAEDISLFSSSISPALLSPRNTGEAQSLALTIESSHTIPTLHTTLATDATQLDDKMPVVKKALPAPPNTSLSRSNSFNRQTINPQKNQENKVLHRCTSFFFFFNSLSG